MSQTLSRFWNDSTKALTPYVPGEQPKGKTYIKLNTNENPYPPSPQVLEAIRQGTNGDLRLYPDPTCLDLRQTIARYHGMNPDQVFVGNGSDEVLAFAFQTFFQPGRPILFPDITYSFYQVYAKLFGLSYELIPVDAEFNIPLEPFNRPHGGIIFPNPNAPTSMYMPLAAIRAILLRNRERAVIIDEAYIDFGGESAIGLIREYPNLLVVRTLSKSRSLAGMRVGYACGSAELIEGLNRVKNSFNSYTLDRLALSAAAAAMRDEGYFKETVQKIVQTRERTAQELKELGFQVLPSQANFLFVSHPDAQAGQLFQRLRAGGILVRYFDRPRIDQFLRVTIGTDEETDSFLRAVTRILAEGGFVLS